MSLGGTATLVLLLLACPDRLLTIASQSTIDPQTLSVTSELGKRLRVHVEALASPELSGRKPGTPGNRAAADYITARFREAHLEPLPSLGGYGQPVSPSLGDNLIAVRPAAAPHRLSPGPLRWLLIGAHYDHLGGRYLGADDNASAVAILLETARLLPPLQHHPILFVAFNTEEPPYIRTPLMGSQYFVDHLPAEIGSAANLQTVIIMDLMGGVHWAPLREVVFAAGAEKSPALYRRVKEVIQTSGRGKELTVLPVGMHLVEEIPLLGSTSFSDYDAFRDASVPFLFLSSGRTPRYHQPSDLPDTLHYERMAATVRWLSQAILHMDQDSEPYSFQADRLEFADEVASFRPIVSQAADEKTKIPGTSFLSLWKLKQDATWIQELDATPPSPEDIKRLERLSMRIQCLLVEFPVCFPI
ncbi:M28 family peptidase [Nitrospiraceae bacterium AH_259_D15_M11_P09]|nr:M28 family peptidase [Nitrospiraceae bacterium AH_259_D15_M11_P09]